MNCCYLQRIFILGHKNELRPRRIDLRFGAIVHIIWHLEHSRTVLAHAIRRDPEEVTLLFLESPTVRWRIVLGAVDDDCRAIES